MPKLEVRLTQSQWDRMEQARGEMGRSDYVRLHLFDAAPGSQHAHARKQAMVRRRAQEQQRASYGSPAAQTGHRPGTPTAAQVALAAGVSFAQAQRIVNENRVRFDGATDRILIDGNAV